MRTPKALIFTLVILLVAAGCGEGKKGPDAKAAYTKNKFVRIATDAVNLPFEFGEGTGVQGFDVDIGEEIAKDLGYPTKWVKMPFEKLFDILRNGEAELVISAISITPERKKDLAFSEPYFDSGNTLAIRTDRRGQTKDMASLSGKKVGVQAGSTGNALMDTQKSASNVSVVRFPTLDDALGALNRMEVDGVVGDEPILTYSIYKSFPNLMTLGIPLTEEKYAVVVRKEEKELLTSVNNTISRLKKSGQLDELRKKWFQDVMEQARNARDEMARQEALKEAPKDVVFNFVKTGGTFRMDRLDGFEVVLAGAQSYRSNPILTNENRGSCRLGNVVPGEYRLNIPIFRLNTTITVPKTAARTVTFNLSIGNTINIEQK